MMEDKKILYSNSVEIHSGFYDFVLDFSTKTPVSQGKTEVQNDIKILMSPQFAKTFLLILQKHMKKYEESFGTINLPEELLKQFSPRQHIM